MDKIEKKGQRYYLYYPNKQGGNNSQTQNMVSMNILPKSLEKTSFGKQIQCDNTRLIPLHSSRYQMQFLDNSLSGKWIDYKPRLEEYSLICEDTHRITWSKSGISMELVKSHLFVSIPFKFTASKQSTEVKESLAVNFLGVDIGEYGVATYLLKSGDFNNKLPKMSFIYAESMRKIREGIKLNVHYQKAGTFSNPSTLVKALRTHSITKIRNRIHAKVVKYQAKPVYEREVSAFESGSGKISKIYHSIKSSDVWSGRNSTDKLMSQLVWGSNQAIGADVSAYATSYCCSHCHQSIYQYIDHHDYKLKKYRVTEVINQFDINNDKVGAEIVVELTQDRRCYGYLEMKRSMLQSGSLDAKEAQKSVKQYARPPLRIISQPRFAARVQHMSDGDLKLLQQKSSEYEKVAGSQSIFVCPFTNCQQVADADLQAAMWIALRGYLEYHKNNKDDKLIVEWCQASGKDKIKYLLKCAREYGIQPVPFSFHKRLST